MSKGVYIKGMEMPTAGTFNIVHIYDDGHVSMPFWGKGMQIVSGITAVPVPEHGRLIDADALDKKCEGMRSIEWNNKAQPYSWAYAYENFQDDIENAPTIIPAEEGE